MNLEKYFIKHEDPDIARVLNNHVTRVMGVAKSYGFRSPLTANATTTPIEMSAEEIARTEDEVPSNDERGHTGSVSPLKLHFSVSSLFPKAFGYLRDGVFSTGNDEPTARLSMEFETILSKMPSDLPAFISYIMYIMGSSTPFTPDFSAGINRVSECLGISVNDALKYWCDTTFGLHIAETDVPDKFPAFFALSHDNGFNGCRRQRNLPLVSYLVAGKRNLNVYASAPTRFAICPVNDPYATRVQDELKTIARYAKEVLRT